MSTQIGPDRLFVHASLWRIEGDSTIRVATVGIEPKSAIASSGGIDDLLRQAVSSDSFVVAGLPAGRMNVVAYAMASPSAPGYVVLAERAIPANRRVAVEDDSAFSNIHFVTYLGDTTRSEDVATTDVRPSELPLRGMTHRVKIPFGHTVITLVASRRSRLGGSLGAMLPWVFLMGGFVVTATASAVSVRLVRRRLGAEQDSATIARLYERLDGRFAEQRQNSETLQRALLPQRNPSLPGLEVASRYMAGARGVEVGGDWYSIVPVDDDHFAFVVGDVSGRGLSAAVIMARLRFTIRAYLVEGHPPDRVLTMCSRAINVTEDEHFATVLVGLGQLSTRELILANAGHLNPLVVTRSTADFIPTNVGVPLGAKTSPHYELTRYTMPPHSTLIAFTDGLVERRGEDLLQGLNRLATATLSREFSNGGSLDDSLTAIVSAMNHEGPDDDIAILAFRWLSEPGVDAGQAG